MPDDRRLREAFSIGFLTKVRANSSLSRGFQVLLRVQAKQSLLYAEGKN